MMNYYDEIVCPEGAEAIDIDEIGVCTEAFIMTSCDLIVGQIIDDMDLELRQSELSLYRLEN